MKKGKAVNSEAKELESQLKKIEQRVGTKLKQDLGGRGSPRREPKPLITPTSGAGTQHTEKSVRIRDFESEQLP